MAKGDRLVGTQGFRGSTLTCHRGGRGGDRCHPRTRLHGVRAQHDPTVALLGFELEQLPEPTQKRARIQGRVPTAN